MQVVSRGAEPVTGRDLTADNFRMTTPELELFDAQPEWRLMLEAYAAAQTAQGWVPRFAAVEHLPAEQMSAVHGKLIALGFLKFEIASQAAGLLYQVTPLGRQALVPPAERQLVPDWMQVEDPLAAAA